MKYCAVSAIFYALAFPFIDHVFPIEKFRFFNLLAWIALIFLGPALLGLLLGINVQENLFRRALQWCGLCLIHAMPTARDWKFGNMGCQWVLVTVKNSTRFAGFCGPESFVSSSPQERNIYMQWIYDIDEENNWSPRGKNGVLIAAGEIRSIKFWPHSSQENDNEQ